MSSPPSPEPSPREAARKALLEWYRANGPDYPWRRMEGDPYAVWVSEVMLQQTQAARVTDAFPAFMSRFPTVETLASASRGEVVRAWAGMGYPRRAVAVHEAARAIVREHAGRVPRDLDALRALPGVGPYTAAAVASIAFGVAVAAVDTNVRKVMARVEHGAERDEIGAVEIQAAAETWLDRSRPGDWNQALMSLGRSVCRTRPRCDLCPLAAACRFRLSGRIGRPSMGAQPRFEGSARQARGAVMAAVNDDPSTVEALVRATGYPAERIVDAVRGLVRDGLVEATPAALAGGLRGRVRLPD